VSSERIKAFIKKGFKLFEESVTDFENKCYNKAVSGSYFAVEAFANALFYYKRQKIKGFRGRLNLIRNLISDDVAEKVESLHNLRVRADHYETLMTKNDAKRALECAKELMEVFILYFKEELPDVVNDLK